MSGFKGRKDSYENKYAHDEKLSFDVEARCSKIFGLWAAEKIGLSGADAQAYALEVVESNLEEPGFEDVLRKVRNDFDQKNLEISDHMMRKELDVALGKAREELEGKKD